MTVPGNLASPLLATAADAAAAAAGPIKSLRFNEGDSAQLTRTPSSAGNRRTWTWSGWVKLDNSTEANIFTGGTSNSNDFAIRIEDGMLVAQEYSGSWKWRLKTSALHRDFSAWYHFVVAFDSTQATSTDRLKIYVNGVQQTSLSTSDYPSQNLESLVNKTDPQYFGNSPAYGYSSFYLADVYFIDGSALGPTSFGAYDDNGVWQAAAYSGTYGTNGFHLLDFANESTVGHDSSGNNNDFTANNISTTAGAGNDVLFDVPTNGSQSDSGAGGEVSGCYATLNPLQAITNSPTNGNLDIGGSSTSTYTKAVSTIYIDPEDTTGYYCEFTVADKGTNPAGHIQLLPPSINLSSSGAGMTGGVGLVMRGGGGGNKWWSLTDQSATTDTGVAHADDQVIGVAVKNGKLYMAINNTWVLSGNPATESNPLFSSLSGLKGFLVGTTDGDWQCNWGQRAFSYSAPTGYRAVSSASLPTPTIADGSDYFDVDTYAGTGASHERSEFSFSPDWVWIKSRTSTNGHNIYDVVRGANKYLSSHLTAAEGTATNELMSFDSDGFTLGDAAGVNGSSKNYVAWAWDAGSSTVSNTDGTITSSVRANQTAGFSIVTYTGTGASGATVGHGLGAAPSFVIIKQRIAGPGTDLYNWNSYHSSLGATKFIALNTTAAASTAPLFNDTSPTSTVFSLGSSTGTYNNVNNASGVTYVAYCFAPVAGYSAFGSYTGNGSSDGPFAFVGFRPALVICKPTTTTGSWQINDSARNTFNVADEQLFANENIAATTTSNRKIDFLSNGFKVRGDNLSFNGSGHTYVYLAFAENPFSANGGLAR